MIEERLEAEADYTAILAGITLEHPIMNAAGTCKTPEDVEKFARSAVAAITLGSITEEPRLGNQGQVYWKDPKKFSLNSLGLPNRGAHYYAEILPEMKRAASQADKPLIVSIAGFTPEEYGRTATAIAHTGIDLIELNLSCPNVWDNNQQKRIACFDPTAVQEIIRQVSIAIASTAVPFGVKTSAFSDPVALEEFAHVVSKTGDVRFVSTVNTFPNSLILDKEGKSVIDVGLAGLSGPAMKPIGLGQVKQLRSFLPPSIDIIGMGGISDGHDVHDYLTAGATAVAVSTAFWNRDENVSVFSDILSDYALLQS